MTVYYEFLLFVWIDLQLFSIYSSDSLQTYISRLKLSSVNLPGSILTKMKSRGIKSVKIGSCSPSQTIKPGPCKTNLPILAIYQSSTVYIFELHLFASSGLENAYILPVLYHVQTNIDRDLSHIMNWSELIWIDLDQIVKPYVSVWVYQVHVSSITSLWLELKLNCRTLIKCWQLFILWLSRLFYAKF